MSMRLFCGFILLLTWVGLLGGLAAWPWWSDGWKLAVSSFFIQIPIAWLRENWKP